MWALVCVDVLVVLGTAASTTLSETFTADMSVYRDAGGAGSQGRRQVFRPRGGRLRHVSAADTVLYVVVRSLGGITITALQGVVSLRILSVPEVIASVMSTSAVSPTRSA